jgi:hypothetical protein
MLAVGTARRPRAVGTDEADSNAVGTDDAFGNAGNAVASGATAGGVVAVASVAAAGLVGEAAWGLDRSVRNFVAPAVLEVVEGCPVSTALGPCAADMTGAGELVRLAAGRLAACAAAGRSVLRLVEPVADGCDAFEEPS